MTDLHREEARAPFARARLAGSLAAALLMIPATAAAATTFLGGGAIPAAQKQQLVSLKANSNGKLTFLGLLGDHTRAACGSVLAIARGVKVNSDRSFTASGQTVPIGGRRGTFAITGHLRSHGRKAVGTAEATFPRGTTTCDTGKVSWRAFNASSPTAHGSLRAGAFYGGVTSQRQVRVHLPLALRVASSRRALTEIAVYSRNACTNHRADTDAVSGDVFLTDIAINDRRRFHSVEHFTSTPASGETAHYTATVNGRFGVQAVIGKWKVSVVIRRNSDGAVLDHCGGKTVKWRASR